MQSMTVPAANFDRLNYFFGQVLGVRHFRAEQDYFREKLKLHNRCLHGYGIVCGLDLAPPVVLGVITGYLKGATVTAAAIDNSARRPLSTATLTRVSGINWHHGGTIVPGAADLALKDPNGLVITFTQPVSAETIVPGVIDL